MTTNEPHNNRLQRTTLRAAAEPERYPDQCAVQCETEVMREIA
jgi:hypothetical protein